MLPANIGQAGDNALSIAASSNKGTLIRYLNDQVEDGFYTLVIDSLKDSNFDLSTMTVDDEVRAQCTKLYELAEFVDFNIKATGHYAIEEWIEPLFRFVYGDIDPTDIDAPVSATGVYRYSVWLLYLLQLEKIPECMRLIGDKIAPLLINISYQILEDDDRPKNFDKALLGYLDLINVVMEMDISAKDIGSDSYINNLEVLYDYVIEDAHAPNDYKIQLSINLFSIYIANKQYEKAFQFYGLNAEYIPIDNLSVYSNFKELIKNVTSTEAAKILSSKVASEISKQEVYNKRIDSLLNETCAFTKKVYQAIENEPEVKKVLQTLGSGAQLSGRQNIPEGAYEYNKLFIECGIKAYVNSDITQKSYEEKYESLEILSKALNVLFEGYSLYEVSNKIEDQYIELTWCCNFLNANPSMLKAFFSVKEKVKVFDVRKKSIVEKNNKNKEVYSMLDNRQKILLFMAAEDMVVNGLNSTKKMVLASSYDINTAKKYLHETYVRTALPEKYKEQNEQGGGGLFGKKQQAMPADLVSLCKVAIVEEMLCKSEYLYHQHTLKGIDKPSNEEMTYSVACLIKCINHMINKKSKAAAAPNKKVIITKTGKVIELNDESGQALEKQESGIIEAIDNIVVQLKDKSESNVKYVKDYIEDLMNTLMKYNWDMNVRLDEFSGEELRNKAFLVIKKLNYDLLK